MSTTFQHEEGPVHYKPRLGVDESLISEITQRYPRGSSVYAYGTAGFRMKADLLPHVVFRVGLLAAVRSMSVTNKAGMHKAIGLMITASHNPVDDNGAKIIDWDGGMLSMEWEPSATALVNTHDSELLDVLRELIDQRANSWPYIKRLPKHAPSAAFETQCEEIAAKVGLTNSRPAEHSRSASSGSVSSLGSVSSQGSLGAAVVKDSHMPEAQQLTISTHPPIVLIGRDTRPSSSKLAELARFAARALGAHVIDYGVCTTPQLHWCVGEMNKRMELNGKNMSFELNTPHISNYTSVLVEAFRMVRRNSVHELTHKQGEIRASNSKLVLDCADGVGGKAVGDIVALLCKSPVTNSSPLLRPISNETKSNATSRYVSFKAENFHFINVGTNEGSPLVNFECGAEYVQKQRKLPRGIDSSDLHELGLENSVVRNQLCASIDGDADRVVFFYLKPKSPNNGSKSEDDLLRLLDGDKIMALLAQYISLLLDKAELSSKLKLGLVQTAYANGASTRYLQNVLKLKVSCARTGVKYLHIEAKKFDIGIYFEANGHGTVLFNDKAREKIRIALEDETPLGDTLRAKALKQLIGLQQLINPYIGDALSDWLLTYTALYEVFGSRFLENAPTRPTELVELWDSMYEDLPSVMDKACVPDRSVLTVSEDERTCFTPQGLQERINHEVEMVRQLESKSGGESAAVARCFVRASGTENIIRIFAEASAPDLARELCAKVKGHVLDLCK